MNALNNRIPNLDVSLLKLAAPLKKLAEQGSDLRAIAMFGKFELESVAALILKDVLLHDGQAILLSYTPNDWPQACVWCNELQDMGMLHIYPRGCDRYALPTAKLINCTLQHQAQLEP